MRINSMKVLGQAIRARRKELGYSQQEMAEYCGKALVVASMLGLDLSIDVRGGAR